MSKTELFWAHGIIKHAVVLVMLWISWGGIEHQTGLVASKSTNPHAYILTACGLLLAGAIAGFVRLSYKDAMDKEGLVSRIHVVIGDITVGLELFIVGVLLLVSVVCLNRCTVVFELGNYPFILACFLYASLVFYDIYDLMKLTKKY